MSSIVSSIFEDKNTVDDREPIVTFELPLLEGEYGLLVPKLSFWVQLSVILAIQIVLCLILSIIMYKSIVRTRGSTPTTSYLMGYGIIIPASLLFPYTLINVLDLRNVMLRFSLFLPTLIVFRTLESMYDTSPFGAEKSLGNYVLYNSCLVEVLFDSKTGQPIKISTSELISRFNGIGIQFLLTIVLYSMVAPVGFEPFEPRNVSEQGLIESLGSIFSLGHLGNQVVGTCLMFLNLNFGQSLVGFTISFVTGYKTKDVMHNPLFETKSPSDFWGRRWNQVTQPLLKKGVYQPIRNAQYSKSIAATATFLASGILHENVWAFLFYNHRNEETPSDSNTCDNCYSPKHGRVILFFVWNGIIILMESSVIGNHKVFRWISQNVPNVMVAFLVMMLSLPVGHWYLGDLVQGRYFYDFRIALPMIVRV